MIEDLFYNQYRQAVDQIGFASDASRDAIQTDDVSAFGCSISISPPSDESSSRHKSVDTLRGYVRDTELFKDHAGTGLL